MKSLLSWKSGDHEPDRKEFVLLMETCADRKRYVLFSAKAMPPHLNCRLLKLMQIQLDGISGDQTHTLLSTTLLRTEVGPEIFRHQAIHWAESILLTPIERLVLSVQSL